MTSPSISSSFNDWINCCPAFIAGKGPPATSCCSFSLAEAFTGAMETAKQKDNPNQRMTVLVGLLFQRGIPIRMLASPSILCSAIHFDLLNELPIF